MNERQIYAVKINIQAAAERLAPVQERHINRKSAKNVSFFKIIFCTWDFGCYEFGINQSFLACPVRNSQ